MTNKPTKKKPFTAKQQRFIDFWDGNTTEAARKAGFKQPRSQGQRLLTNVDILEAISHREKKRNKPNIKSREDRQEFWSDKMDNAEKESDQIKASELLGRSEADFTDKQRYVDKDGEDLEWRVKIVEPKG